MLRTVSVPDNLTLGKLYLCSMPGRFEPLEVFLQAQVPHLKLADESSCIPTRP